MGLRSRDGKTWLSTNVFVRRRLVRIALKRYQGKLSQDTSKLVLGLVKEKNTAVINVISKQIGKKILKGKLKKKSLSSQAQVQVRSGPGQVQVWSRSGPGQVQVRSRSGPRGPRTKDEDLDLG